MDHLSYIRSVDDKGNSPKRGAAWHLGILLHKWSVKGKRELKNGKMDGDWIGFSVNGNINEEYTGNFKDGVKVN